MISNLFIVFLYPIGIVDVKMDKNKTWNAIFVTNWRMRKSKEFDIRLYLYYVLWIFFKLVTKIPNLQQYFFSIMWISVGCRGNNKLLHKNMNCFRSNKFYQFPNILVSRPFSKFENFKRIGIDRITVNKKNFAKLSMNNKKIQKCWLKCDDSGIQGISPVGDVWLRSSGNIFRFCFHLKWF